MKTEVFEYGDVINYILLTLRMLREGCYRFYIVLRFRVDGRKRFEYATCERVLSFQKTEDKNSPFSKVSDTCGRGLNLLFFLPFSWRRRRRRLRSPLSFLLIISSLLSPKCAWWTSTDPFTPYLPLFRNTHAHSEVFRLQKHHNLIKYFRCHYIQNTISLFYKELKGPWCHRDLHCEILKEEHFAKNSVSNISSLCHRLLDTVQRYTIYHTEQKLLAHDETRNLFAIFRVAFRSGRMLEL